MASTIASSTTHQAHHNTAAEADHQGVYQNVSEAGRIGSLLAGAGLAFYGLHRGSWLGTASVMIGASLLHRGWTGYCAAYDRLGINEHDASQPRPGVRAQHGQKVVASILIQRDRRDIYDFWRNLENLPRVIGHLQSVTAIDEKRSRWVAAAPLGQSLSWEAEIINDRPGELIAWQSLPGAQVDTAGSVHLNESASGTGTEVVVSLKYDPPGGQFTDRFAQLFGVSLEDHLRDGLLDLKRTLEASSTATSPPTNTP